MRTRRIAAAVLALFATAAVAAQAQSVKRWSALPGREVRTIPLRGSELGGEPALSVVPAADGWIYLRGKFGLYRLLGGNGAYERAASFAWCDGRQATAVVPFRTPGFACSANGKLIEVGADAQYRRVLPAPRRDPNHDVYAADYPMVNWIDRAESGDWWFAYGYARTIGYLDPSGAAHLVELADSDVVRDVARLGSELVLIDDRCVMRTLHRLRQTAAERVCVPPFLPLLRRAGDAIWLLSAARDKGYVRRIDAAGRATAWHLPYAVSDVATDPRDGTTYFLGQAPRSGRTVLAVLGRDGVPRATVLPMSGGYGMAVDRRHRIWISVPFEHALAVIAPPGEWDDHA